LLSRLVIMIAAPSDIAFSPAAMLSPPLSYSLAVVFLLLWVVTASAHRCLAVTAPSNSLAVMFLLLWVVIASAYRCLADNLCFTCIAKIHVLLPLLLADYSWCCSHWY